jgi:hypothetical protein
LYCSPGYLVPAQSVGENSYAEAIIDANKRGWNDKSNPTDQTKEEVTVSNNDIGSLSALGSLPLKSKQVLGTI